MIEGARVRLRPFRDADLDLLARWGEQREALWGDFQRFQLDLIPRLRDAYRQTGLLGRDSGWLLVEMRPPEQRPLVPGEPLEVVGFVRYGMLRVPDGDAPHPEIGYGITVPSARGKGLAREALALLLRYLFDGYPAERISALTDVDNAASRRLLESMNFWHEGTLRRAMFRDGGWRDVALYGLLRAEFASVTH